MKLLSSLIKASDFKQLRHLVILKNDTSGTGVFDPKTIKINSFEKESISLTLPSNTVGPNHNLTLYIYESPLDAEELKKIKNKNFKSGFEVLGKVSEVNADEINQYVKVELTQYDTHSWKHLCEKYDKVQLTILDLVDQDEEYGA